MCRDVPTFMVSMEHQVQASYVPECLGLRHAQHRSIIASPVQGWIGRHVLTVKVNVAENPCCNDWDLPQEAERVIQDIRPAVCLLHCACTVRLPEGAPWLQSQQSH